MQWIFLVSVTGLKVSVQYSTLPAQVSPVHLDAHWQLYLLMRSVHMWFRFDKGCSHIHRYLQIQNTRMQINKQCAFNCRAWTNNNATHPLHKFYVGKLILWILPLSGWSAGVYKLLDSEPHHVTWMLRKNIVHCKLFSCCEDDNNYYYGDSI